MKKVKIFAATFMLMAFFLAAMHGQSFGAGHHHRGEGGPGMDGQFLKAIHRLQLTEAQKHDIAVILKQHREQSRTLLQQMFDARKKLFETVSADTFDENAVRQAARQVAGNEEEMAVLRAEISSEIKKVLTPEQLDKLTRMKADFSQRVKERVDRRLSIMDRWIDTYGG